MRLWLITCWIAGACIGRAEIREGVQPPGFGAEVTGVERRLAERPEPGRDFVRMTAQWHGVPGWAVLRERWQEFGKTKPAFAVLAALLRESEGEPDLAVTELRAVPGPDARWNEGRLLAILGREAEAVKVLSDLSADPACPPDRAAEAVLALTELDCIKGDFAAALVRSRTAWDSRSEEDFRLRLIERHLSLLMEAGGGGDRAFVDQVVEQSADAASPESGRMAARRLMVVLSEWMPSDARLMKAREELAAVVNLPFRPLDRETMPPLPGPLPPGLDPTPAEAWRLLPLTVKPSRLLLEKAARQLQKTGSWPENLTAAPALRKWFEEEPAAALQALFPATAAAGPMPPLFRNLVSELKPGSARRLALDLTDRAWAGGFGGGGDPEEAPEAVRALENVIVAARPFCDPEETSPTGLPAGMDAWEQSFGSTARFPSAVIWWNFQGSKFAEYYALQCRVNPTLPHWPTYGFGDAAAPMTDWQEWRPDFPPQEADELVAWAWKALIRAGRGTPERAAAIADRIPDEISRVTFACISQHRALLAEWLKDRELTRRLPSVLLSKALTVIYGSSSPGLRAAMEEEMAANVNCVEEMGRRLGFDPVDFKRSGLMPMGDPPAQWLAEWRKRPVDSRLAAIASGKSGDEEWDVARAAAALPDQPHPLTGLRVCPSVDTLRRLGWQLAIPSGHFEFYQNEPYELMRRLLGGDESSPGRRGENMVWQLRPETMAAIEAFPTAHPLKRQLRRWAEISAPEKKPRRPGERDLPIFPRSPEATELRKARNAQVRMLAGEEQAWLPWHLVATVLEENPVKKELLREILNARSPAVVDLPTAQPDYQNPQGWPGTTGDPVENLVKVLRRLLADPDRMPLLARSGEIGFRSISYPPAPDQLNAAITGVGYEKARLPQAADALLALRDPVAARLAVALGERLGEERSQEILLRALAIFPDDPDLLLAFSASERSGDPAARRAAFVRALGNMKSLTTMSMNFSVQSGQWWCGRYKSWDNSAGSPGEVSPEEVAAIVGFVQRSGAWELPPQWNEALTHYFGFPGGTVKLLDIPATVRAVVRCLGPKIHADSPETLWQLLSPVLSAPQYKALRREVAEKLLTGVPDPDSAASGGASAPTLAPGPEVEASKGAFGIWEGFGRELRAGPDPLLRDMLKAAVAGVDMDADLNRLKAIAARHPASGTAALTALVAIGMADRVRPEDLAILAPLPPDVRLRVLSHASRLLSGKEFPEQLPQRHEAWEWECRTALQASSPKWDQVLVSLGRLRQAGDDQAVSRMIPLLLKALRAWPRGRQPSGNDIAAACRVVMFSGTEAERDVCRTFIESRLELDASLFKDATAMARLVRLFPVDADVPARLAAAVDEALKRMREGNPLDYFEMGGLQRLIGAVALRPRWQPAVREILAANPKLWTYLNELLLTLDSGLPVPDPGLSFEPTGPGKGVVRWNFRGLLSTPGTDAAPDWKADPSAVFVDTSALAASLAGKFEAVVTVEEPQGQSRAVVAKIPAMPGIGSLPLPEGLPAVGRLRMTLSQTGRVPAPTGTTPPLACNTLPLVCTGDAWGGPLPAGADRTADPPGWRLLCQPVEIGKARAWQVRNAEVPPDAEAQNANPGSRGHAGGGGRDPLGPPGGYLLLLDDSGQVCAASDLTSREYSETSTGFVDFPGTVVLRESLKPWIEPRRSDDNSPTPVTSSDEVASGPLIPEFAVMGAPTRLALAVRTAPLSGSSRAAVPAAPDGTVSVREWPLPVVKVQNPPTAPSANPAAGEMSQAGTGRLEILRMLRGSGEGWYQEVAVSTARPVKVAWISQGRLHVAGLEEPGKPLEIPLPEGFARNISAVVWNGGKTVSVLSEPSAPPRPQVPAKASAEGPATADGSSSALKIAPANNKASATPPPGRPPYGAAVETRLVSVDLSGGEPAVSAPRIFNREIKVMHVEDPEPDAPTVLVDDRYQLAGLIVPDGRFLPWISGTGSSESKTENKPGTQTRTETPAGSGAPAVPTVEWTSPAGPSRVVFGSRFWADSAKEVRALDWTDGSLRLVTGVKDWQPPHSKPTGDKLTDPLLPGRSLDDSGTITRRFGPQALKFEVLVSLGNNEYIARRHDHGGFVIALCRDNAPR